MTKDKLVDNISAKCEGMKKIDIKKCLDATFACISECLQEGDSVAVSGFGTFQINHRSARRGVNPKTLEKIDIPACKVPKFKASATLKKICK